MPSETVLAFDFGLKRIGVAVGDLSMKIPHPLETIEQAEDQKRFAAITKLIDEWKPVLLVVGQPTHMNGDAHKFARATQKFARKLEGKFHIKIKCVDECLSSCSAESLLTESGTHKRKKKQVLDSVAAQEILRTYFSQVQHDAA